MPTSSSSSSSRSTSRYLNNSALVADLTVDRSERVDRATRDGQIVAAVRTICPPAVFGDDDELSVATLGGGLSNLLFVVRSAANAVLVRIHVGEEDARFVDREVENRVLAWLGRHGHATGTHLAPTFYGRFTNGRVEDFYDDHHTLRCDEMARYAPRVAAALAAYHRLEVPRGLCKTEKPSCDPGGGGGGEIWSRVDGWFELAARASFPHDEAKTQALLSLHVTDVMVREWTWLKGKLSAVRSPTTASDDGHDAARKARAFAREVVFTHMDCQSLNILVSTTTQQPDDDDANLPTIRLIDFEYAGHNPRACDLANTWCEYCDMNNLQADYEHEYPSQQQQERFLRAYLLAAASSSQEDATTTTTTDLSREEEEEAFLEELRRDVNRHALVSHLGYAAWGVAQAHLSPIDYDYLAYARHRMDGYFTFKDRFMASDITDAS